MRVASVAGHYDASIDVGTCCMGVWMLQELMPALRHKSDFGLEFLSHPLHVQAVLETMPTATVTCRENSNSGNQRLL